MKAKNFIVAKIRFYSCNGIAKLIVEFDGVFWEKVGENVQVGRSHVFTKKIKQ